jgi:hypothetical protein
MIEGHDYTIYSHGPGGRSRMYALIALITAFLTPLAQHGILVLLRRYWGDDWNLAETALFFGGFTALIMFGVLINLFDSFLWHTWVGGWMFRVSGLPVPPNLAGEYHGEIALHSATDPAAVYRTGYFMQIAQTWEQMSLLIERQSEAGGLVRVHSDMASIRVGMMSGVTTLRFVYTFEENLSRREGAGTMARQFSGAATFEFRRDGEAWVVTGHFFDDIGRSGQISVRQGLAGVTNTTFAAPPPAGPTTEAKPAGIEGALDRAEKPGPGPERPPGQPKTGPTD